MKLFNNILTILLLLLIVIGVVCFNSVGTYSHDDWWAGFFWYNSIIQNILSSDQGLVWSWAFGKFVTHTIPGIFHLHPQQNIFAPIVKGINFAIYTGLLALFFSPVKRKIPNPIVIIANFLLIFSIVFFVDYQLLVQMNQNSKYLFNLIIGTSIWYIWINEFFNDKFLIEKNIIRDCIFVFILAFTGHLVNIPTIILFTFLFMYKVFQSENRKDSFKKLFRMAYPIIGIYIICGVLYMNIPGLTYIRMERVPQDSILVYSITHFMNFTKEFFKFYFSNIYFYSLLIITVLGFVGMLINWKKIDKKYFVVASAIFTANFVFQYALLTCGTTFYDHKSYWFVSLDITATFLLYLILCCNIIYGCLYRLLDKKVYKIVSIILVFVIINLIYPINKALKNGEYVYHRQLVQREAIYKLSKIWYYYALRGDTIYVPREYYINLNALAYYLPWDFINKNMMLVYKVKKPKEFKLILKKITNENEMFTEDELKNIDFKRLYDELFVLKMKAPKYEE